MKQWEFPSSAEWSLHPPLRWLGWRVKADRDCSASGVGSRNHSPLECCLVRYSLNSHTNRWIALPLFFFFFNVCQTLALHWIVLILRLQTSHSGKMDESDMPPCIEEHKSHFWCAFFFFFPQSFLSFRLSCIPHIFVLQPLQIKTTCPTNRRSYKGEWVWFISGD